MQVRHQRDEEKKKEYGCPWIARILCKRTPEDRHTSEMASMEQEPTRDLQDSGVANLLPSVSGATVDSHNHGGQLHTGSVPFKMMTTRTCRTRARERAPGRYPDGHGAWRILGKCPRKNLADTC